MEDLTLISCSYNTPAITLAMLKSWVKFHNYKQKALICDNSTNDNTSMLLGENNIPHFKQPGGTHGDGVNLLIEKCTTKYALLVDTDIIFLKQHNEIFKKIKDHNLTIMGKVEGDRGGKKIHNRVNPWHCFIDIDNIKQNNITFFQEERMKESFNRDRLYDIGSTFFEDVKAKKLKIGDIDLQYKYYYHYEGMSWYKNKYKIGEDTGIDFGGTHNNYGYVVEHDRKYENFIEMTKSLDKVVIKNIFI